MNVPMSVLDLIPFVDGVLIPTPFSVTGLLGSPRFGAQIELLRQPQAQTPAYDRIVDDVLELIAGRYCSASRRTITSARGRCWTRCRPTGQRSGRRRSWTART